ncbi:alpha alpha-trehalose-phosphate synthase [UDP-forming] 1 [Phtheirospermum japonicum]|uniref:Alpha alpha-trehalose-phosphate synthase [UDP-forming] 1 n=1 Tax=Phtheirospermum japonicum TaxID=374723 RepID=A0A830C1C8_9LAMI|nr:alpha alpha-trehalose-phosphate synthase [UDP-forming] 1 [Phtheirospermum japonicum]
MGITIIYYGLFTLSRVASGGPPRDHRSFHSQFTGYKKANQMFSDIVHKHYEEVDVVWCHDYHLMFLPKCLKEHNSEMKVRWFLHTPFPSSDTHRTLPSRSELLRAILAGDLVGILEREIENWCERLENTNGGDFGLRLQGVRHDEYASECCQSLLVIP